MDSERKPIQDFTDFCECKAIQPSASLQSFLSPISYLLSLLLVLPLLMAFRVYVPSFTPFAVCPENINIPWGQKSGVKQEA